MFEFQLHVDKHQDALALASARHVAGVLSQAIAMRGRAFLALSGGKSPLLFWRSLFDQPLDWSAVTIVPVDERWVTLNHVDSNEGIIRQMLAQGLAAKSRWISLYVPGLDSAQQAQAQVEQRLLQELPESLDLVVLGLGEDGHTASWFPQSPQRDDCLNSPLRCRAIDPVSAEHERMTLTASYVLQANELCLYAPGVKKIDTLSLVLQQQNEALYPVMKIFQHPRLHWWASP
jgi:6-phosphogluconolactonase